MIQLMNSIEDIQLFAPILYLIVFKKTYIAKMYKLSG